MLGLSALRLAALQIDRDPDGQGCERSDVAACPIGSDGGGGGSGRAKRKAPPAAPRAHWGLSSDGSARLALIALSRLLRTQDEGMLAHAAASPIGAALLDALRAAVLRVAVEAGGADQDLRATSVDTLFNLSGSTFASASRYDASSLTLPSKLPFARAKALLRALLDSLAAALLVAEGGTLVGLLRVLPPRPLDEAAQATIRALVAAVEADATRRLRLVAGGSSSSSSTRSVHPPGMAEPPLPMPMLQPAPTPAPPSNPPPNPLPIPPPDPHNPQPMLDVSTSLASNARRLVQSRLGRPMTPAELQALDAGLVEALGVLRVGTNEEHRAALRSVALTELSTPAGAQLWACLLEEASRGVQSVAEYAMVVVAAAGAVASAQFASALGLQ